MTLDDPDIYADDPAGDRPFPLAPLLERAGISKRRLTMLVAASGSAMGKATTSGLTWQQADVWAIRCGHHPAEIWGNWWSEIPTDDEEDET